VVASCGRDDGQTERNPVVPVKSALRQVHSVTGRSLRGMIYLGACLIAGIRLAGERVIPTSHAIEESVDLAHEIYNRVFRKVPERIVQK
jgi:hypothetical protein